MGGYKLSRVSNYANSTEIKIDLSNRNKYTLAIDDISTINATAI